MSYSHLTITERIKIEAYLELGLKPCQIANKLGVHRSTISRELRRCQNGYSAALAQEQYDHRAKQKGRKSCLKLMNTPRNMILSEIFSISSQGLQFSRKLSYIFNTWLFYKGDKLMRLDLKIDRDLAFEQALFEIPYHKKIAT